METGKLTVNRNHVHRVLTRKFTEILNVHPHAKNLTGLATALASGVFEVLNVPEVIEIN